MTPEVGTARGLAVRWVQVLVLTRGSGVTSEGDGTRGIGGAGSDRHTQTDSLCEEVAMSLFSDRGDTDGRDAARPRRLANLRVLEMACDDGHRTLALSGELDVASFWLLDHPLLQIEADGATSFTLDLAGLTFIDSSGIRAVLAARALCAAHGCEFRLIPGPARVQRAFEVSGLIDHLPFSNE